MAVVPISKLRIITLKHDYTKIIERLSATRAFAINERGFALPACDYTDELKAVEVLQARTSFAISYLHRQNDYYTGLKNKPFTDFEYTPPDRSSVRRAVSAEKLFSIKEREAGLFALIDLIDGQSFRQNEIAHEQRSTGERLAELESYSAFTLPFSRLGDTAAVFSALYRAGAGAKLPRFDGGIYYEEIGSGTGSLLFVCGLLTDKDAVNSALIESGYALCPYTGEFTAASAAETEREKLAALTAESGEVLKSTLLLNAHYSDLLILYDYYQLLLERYNQRGAAAGDFITVVEGWCPAEAAESICDALSAEFESIYFEIAGPEADDNVPTLLRNNKLVEPFEDLTAMYTTPAYTDKDPNSLMSIWFFLFFGMMIGDAVYGILLTVGAALFLRFKKSEKGMSNLVKLIGICGISSVIWGIVFGSFMGFGIKTSSTIFSYAVVEDGSAVRYFGWFNPMEEPIMLLGLSIIGGIAHLLFAFCIKAVILLSEKKLFAALCDAGFNIMITLGIALLGLNIFAEIFLSGKLDLSAKVFSESASAALSQAGMILLVVGIAGIFLLAGRESIVKGRVMGWFGSGLNGLYGGIIGLVADILSYSRIFGLGLAGGAIAFAFNTLVQELFFSAGGVMMVVGGVLLFALHIFNLGISLLGTYVHNARLQFLEYYGKFLTGEGKAFLPLGETTKYTVLSK